MSSRDTEKDTPKVSDFPLPEDDEELKAVKDALAALPSVERVYNVELVDAEGVVHASIEKTVYIKREALSN